MILFIVMNSGIHEIQTFQYYVILCKNKNRSYNKPSAHFPLKTLLLTATKVILQIYILFNYEPLINQQKPVKFFGNNR